MVETPLSPGNFAMTPSPGLKPEQGHALSSSLFNVPLFDPPRAAICQGVFPGDLANNNVTDLMVFIHSPSGVLLQKLQNWTHEQPIKKSYLPQVSGHCLFPNDPPAITQHQGLCSILLFNDSSKTKVFQVVREYYFFPLQQESNSPDIF